MLTSKVPNIKEILKLVRVIAKQIKIMCILNAKSVVPKCLDCGLVGHYNKSYYKFSKYNPHTANYGNCV